MRVEVLNKFCSKLLKSIKFGILKRILFPLSLAYFCIYFFKNIDQISFEIDSAGYSYFLVLSFVFCVLSIFFNALAWKRIVIWFGENNIKGNLISFYLLTNILKYVPGGFWHFFERFNFIKKNSNAELALYSTLIEPYFMLCSSFFLASIGIIFSPFYILLTIPSIFLNRKLIYFVLVKLEALKRKTITSLKITNSKYKFEERIKLNSFFPLKAFLIEILFVLSKFIGFIFCFNLFNLDVNSDVSICYLLVIFCFSWAIGLIVPTAPGGVGVFEACFLFLIGENIPDNIIIISLIYFRLISTSADIFLSFPLLLKKSFKRI